MLRTNRGKESPNELFVGFMCHQSNVSNGFNVRVESESKKYIHI